MSRPFNAVLLLADLAPEIFGLIAGYTEADRAKEILRLAIAAPANYSGYVTQVDRGTRDVRIDAMRQLQCSGIQFNIDVSEIEIAARDEWDSCRTRKSNA